MFKGESIRVLIAVDPYETEELFSPEVFEELKAWLGQGSLALEAVYVCTHEKKEVMAADRRARIFQDLKAKVSRYHFRFPVSYQVLESDSVSQRDRALVLSDYAKKESADSIVLSSHGRKTVAKLILGSFTECLLRVAETPVLILAHRRPFPAPNRNFLFLTDFSNESRQAFHSLLHRIEGDHAKIIVLHASLVQTYIYDFGFLSVAGYVPDNYWELHRKQLVKLSKDWLREAQSKGISAELIVDEGSTSQLESVMSTVAEHQVSCVAVMAKQTQGIVEELIHESRLPVWVWGPRAFEARVGRQTAPR